MTLNSSRMLSLKQSKLSFPSVLSLKEKTEMKTKARGDYWDFVQFFPFKIGI
jgi:hypothetical protein